MPPLLVIPAMPGSADATRQALPALPALCELLRLADPSDVDADWRTGMLRDLAPAHRAIPEAVIAAAALDLPVGAGVCLAAPVHAVAGLHRVHLHHAGILQLPGEEQSQLAAQFASQFGSEVRLHPAGSQWLLEGAGAAGAWDSDPEEWVGAPLERQPAACADQRLMRRLGAEIEMWLADLPMNEGRRRRGQLPVNLLWMWGGGTTRARNELPALPALPVHGATSDAWLAGFAVLTGGVVLPIPANWRAFDAARSLVVLQPAQDAAQLTAWDEDWFAPALADLRAGRIQSLDLRLGRRLHHVRRGRFRRLLRRSKPWWQQVQT
jgi:hypothetical protein